MSFGDRRSVTLPLSLKIVGHGVVALHGAGVVTYVMTSDSRNPASVPAVEPPLDPCSRSTTRKTGARPCRTTSPHEAALAAMRNNPASFFKCLMTVLCASDLDDAWRDEDQQLGALVVGAVA